METVEFEYIARLHNDFRTKFGLPRQSGLAEHLYSRVVMEKPYRIAEAFRGIEDFDLFTMAEQVIGREAVTERILSAVPSLVKVSADGDTFLKIRKDIGDELDHAL